MSAIKKVQLYELFCIMKDVKKYIHSYMKIIFSIFKSIINIIKVKNDFAIRNSEAEVAPPKTKGDPAVIPYITKELNR